MESKIEHIIVGAGLAGLLLAWELHQRGTSFFIYSNQAPASSSVAAGTWNPVSFRTMTPTWRAQEMIDRMDVVYHAIDAELGTSMYGKLKVEKILANNQEKDFWEEKAKSERSRDFLEEVTHEVEIKGEKCFAGVVKQTGRLDLPDFVIKLRAYFKDKGYLIEEDFKYDELEVKNSFSVYGKLQAQKVIFTEGTYIIDNPWFSWLPFRPVKGDVLTIKSVDLKVDTIRKKNVFILPIGNDLYKIGATYHWKNKSWNPSNEARLEIIEKFEKITDCTYEIIDHKSGIRPATHDRRAIIGAHPTFKNLYVFNGLGSKGVFLGPLLINEFCDSLEGSSEVHPEVSINRCIKKYFLG